jgi:hypothetical protein
MPEENVSGLVSQCGQERPLANVSYPVGSSATSSINAKFNLKKPLISSVPKVLVASAVVTLLSSCVPRTVELIYPGTMDCDKGCQFVAGGWPFAYVVDAHGLSPAGSVDLIGALLSEDLLRVDMLFMTFTFWVCVYLALTYMRQRG